MDPNHRALGPKYHSDYSTWGPLPHYLSPWTLRDWEAELLRQFSLYLSATGFRFTVWARRLRPPRLEELGLSFG